MVSIAEFLIGHSSHGAVLLRYLRDLNFGKNEFLRKHKVHVCLLRFIVYKRVTVSYSSMTVPLALATSSFLFSLSQEKVRCERNYRERGGKLICVPSIVFFVPIMSLKTSI